MQRDLKQIMQINDEFQNQSAAFRDKENQFVELGREYREKLEILKFERERIALKEEQFLSQIHKVETETKQEVKRAHTRFESQLLSRTRDMERRIEDLEDKLNHAYDEGEEVRSKNERLERIVNDQKTQIEQAQRKEDSIIAQY